MANTSGIQIKIPELDPYSAEVVVDSEGELHPEWSASEEHPSEAGLVPVSVPAGTNSRYTVKVPMPVPGDGLVQEKNGVINVNYDPHTMELRPDGTLAARTSTCDGVTFTSGEFAVTDGWHRFEFKEGDRNCYRSSKSIMIAPDNYPVNASTTLPEGEIVVPADIKWMKFDALVSFEVPNCGSNSWEYSMAFVVRELDSDNRVLVEHEFPFTVDTTEPVAVVSCPISVYNGTFNPVKVDTGLKWNRGTDPVLGVTCIGKVTLTAN